MREFIFYSEKARTSGNFQDLMSAGRIDIAIHTIIASFFLSNKLRDDVKLHMIFNGPPDAPKHLEFVSNPEMPISKKDVAKLIKIMLFKSKRNGKVEVFPGCFIEKKSLMNVIKEIKDKPIYLLDKKGEDIRNIKLNKDSVFILGDHEGIPKKEKKEIEKIAKSITVGPENYFSSQVVVILNNHLDLI